jgi:hypothetical protein
MKKWYILEVLASHYCQVVLVIMILAAYSLVPAKIFSGLYWPLAISFMLVFGLTITCLVRTIKERIIHRQQTATHSVLGVISAAIGLSALQFCTVSGVCGASVGMAVVSLVFPKFAYNLFDQYAVWITVLSIVLQLISLWQMKCFKTVCCQPQDKKIKAV